MKDFRVNTIEVWHEWLFSSEGIKPLQPKWVTTTHTQPFLPNQVTPVHNLFLAGAHTRTQADVWSIEGAVESGRRAAKAIDPRVKVIPQYKPLWLRAISGIDDLCYALGFPHILDIFLGLIAIAALAMLLKAALRLI